VDLASQQSQLVIVTASWASIYIFCDGNGSRKDHILVYKGFGDKGIGDKGIGDKGMVDAFTMFVPS